MVSDHTEQVKNKCKYYYRQQGSKSTGKNVREDILKNVLTSILNMGNGANGSVKPGNSTGQYLATSPDVNPNALQNFTSTDNEDEKTARRPHAYLNYILMDTAMKFIKGGALRVGDSDPANPEWKNLAQQDIEATQQGYFLVYVSNEEKPTADMNAGNVYFDNFILITNEGPVMEENHYYPFGLLMNPISSTGSGRLENKYKFQGQEFAGNEFSDGSGLEMYEFKWRMHDPQIGRFWQIDPLSNKYVYNSTYAFSENKVVNNIELEGTEALPSPIYTNNLASSYGYMNFSNYNAPPYANNPINISQVSGGAYNGSSFSYIDYFGERATITDDNDRQLLFNPRVSVKSDLPADGLQIIQVAYGSALPYGGVLYQPMQPLYTAKYVQQMMLNGKMSSAFVDGGINSPDGEAEPGTPYYVGSIEMTHPDFANSNWSNATNSGSITALDFPNAATVYGMNNLNFETYFLLKNYNNSGQDRVVGRIDWGYTNRGYNTVGFPKVYPTDGFSPLAASILFNDYTKYSIYKPK